jgi:uncharacterized protein YkwD
MIAPRIRSLVVGAVVSTMAAAFVAPSAQANPRHAYRPASAELRARMLGFANHARTVHDLTRLRLNMPLSNEALRHSRRMAHDEQLSHTGNLADLVRNQGGSVFGENIARGRGLRGILDAWLRRAETQRILLDPRFLRVGLGVVHVDGFYWVTFQAFD